MIVLYEVVIIAMILIEFNYYKTIITPFSMLGTFYALVPIILLVFGSQSRLYPMTNTNYMYTAFYLFCFWCANIIFMIVFRSRTLFQPISVDRNIEKTDNLMQIFHFLYVICIIAFTAETVLVIREYGLTNTKNHTFGILAHLGYLALMIAPVAVYDGIKHHKISNLVLTGAFFVELVLLQNKLPVVILLLHATFFYLIMNGRPNNLQFIRRFVVIVLAAMLVFIAIYAIPPFLITKSATLKESLDYSFERFFHYFFSGFISSNEYYLHPQGNGSAGYRVAFGFFDTIKEALFGNGNYMNPVIKKWVLIAPGSGTNVGGLFSEAVYQIGYFDAALYVFAVGAMVYFVYNMSSQYQTFLITNSYLLAVVSVSFFCNFFSLFSTFEKMIYAIFLDLLILYLKPKKIVIKFSTRYLDSWE